MKTVIRSLLLGIYLTSVVSGRVVYPVVEDDLFVVRSTDGSSDSHLGEDLSAIWLTATQDLIYIVKNIITATGSTSDLPAQVILYEQGQLDLVSWVFDILSAAIEGFKKLFKLNDILGAALRASSAIFSQRPVVSYVIDQMYHIWTQLPKSKREKYVVQKVDGKVKVKENGPETTLWMQMEDPTMPSVPTLATVPTLEPQNESTVLPLEPDSLESEGQVGFGTGILSTLFREDPNDPREMGEGVHQIDEGSSLTGQNYHHHSPGREPGLESNEFHRTSGHLSGRFGDNTENTPESYAALFDPKYRYFRGIGRQGADPAFPEDDEVMAPLRRRRSHRKHPLRKSVYLVNGQKRLLI